MRFFVIWDKKYVKVWIKTIFKSKEWSKYNYGVLVLLNCLSEIKARQGNIVAGSAKLANFWHKYRNKLQRQDNINYGQDTIRWKIDVAIRFVGASSTNLPKTFMSCQNALKYLDNWWENLISVCRWRKNFYLIVLFFENNLPREKYRGAESSNNSTRRRCRRCLAYTSAQISCSVAYRFKITKN